MITPRWGDDLLKDFSYIFKKHFFCSWIHWNSRCYPEVWKKNSRAWHCDKCDPCNAWFTELEKERLDALQE